MKDKITRFVDKSFSLLFPQKHDVVTFLKGHERKTLLLSNLEKEIAILQRETCILLTEKEIEDLCYDFARMFADAAIKEKEKQLRKMHIVR